MKKLYNYVLPVLLLVFAVSCDGDNEEVVNIINQDPVVTVTEVSPNKGYEDNEFTVKGTNFGIIASDVKVYVGSSELEIVSCEDEAITVRVPQGATAGRISVVVYGQKVDTQLMYDVLGNPGVVKIEPVYGFVGDEITFKGHDLGVSSTFYNLLFAGKAEAALFSSEPTVDSFVVKVPNGAESGEITLTITDKPVNLPVPFTVLQHATLDKLSLETGFAGSQVTITGTNLNPEILASEGLELEGIRVFFKKGKKDEPVAAEVVGDPTNTEIKVKVPADLVAGEYAVTVSTSFETIEKTLTYTVLPTPGVTGISVQKGYINAEVAISGTNFGTNADHIKVFFDEMECSSVKLNKSGNIVVNVPKGVTPSENVVIRLVIMDTEIPMGKYGTFNVLQTPEISSVQSSYVYPYGTLVEVGEEIILIGHDFDTNKNNVSVTFDGVTAPAEITNITSTKITVKVPNGFNAGKVTVVFTDIDEPVISDKELTLLPANGDITKYVLKNSVQPFQGAGFAGAEWDRDGLHDWEKTDIQNNGGLQYPSITGGRDSNGCIALHQWGKRNNKNGKMWQKTSLPKGKYRIGLDGISLGKSSGYSNAAFVVCKGTEASDIPGYDNGNWIAGQTGVKGEIAMTIGHQASETLNLNLTENLDHLIVGFVVWADNTVWATFTSVTVHLVTE